MRLSTGLVAICCLCLAGPVLAAPSETPPSFVVIMTDDQGINSLQNMSLLNSVLTQQGLTFKNSFVDFSLCSPSRSSFFTGKSSHSTGIVGNRKSQFGGYSAFKNMESNSLPSWLKIRRIQDRDLRQIYERVQPSCVKKESGRSFQAMVQL